MCCRKRYTIPTTSVSTTQVKQWKGRLTLAKKFDSVHINTVNSNNKIPSVLRATPSSPRRARRLLDPFVFVVDRGRKCDVLLFLDGCRGVSSSSAAATGAYVGRPKSASSGMNSPMRGPGAAMAGVCWGWDLCS